MIMIYNDQTFIIHLYAFLKKKFIIRHLTSARKARKARKAIKVRKARKARKTRKAREARKVYQVPIRPRPNQRCYLHL